MSKIPELTAKRDSILTKARNVAEAAKAANRSLTPAETTAVNTHISAAKDISAELKAAVDTQTLLDSLQDPGQAKATGSHAYLDRSPRALRAKGAEVREMIRTKELIGTGTKPIATSFTNEPVMLPGQTAYTLSQLLTRKVLTSPTYQYLRQTEREHNAAVVAVGAEKPESKYGFEAVKGELAIIAHLSEPFHEYWAADFPEAVEALTAELLNGIFDAEEDLILNGSGTNGNPRGILNTSGIQTQAYATDQLTTTRTAVTKLETIGYQAGAFVLNPVDWQDIELTRNTSGQLEYGTGPIDRAAMRLWGVPVATSTRVAQGTGLALDLDAAHVLTDAAVQLAGANTHGSDFSHNQIRLRAEQRFDVAVTKPQGIVKMTLTTTP